MSSSSAGDPFVPGPTSQAARSLGPRASPSRACRRPIGRTLEGTQVAAPPTVRAAPPGTQRLVPYVSRLALEWLRDDPDARHRRVHGSLAFVDISGFTNLTERLSRKGKVGAE